MINKISELEKKNEALTREKEESERSLEIEIKRNTSFTGKRWFVKMVSEMLEGYHLKDTKATHYRKDEMENELREIATRFFIDEVNYFLFSVLIMHFVFNFIG
ncbi:hypothetical protein QL285_017802 [Trifolium repens]|nr:hypothetical protein QL285_017802 [Trifolium repens]